MCTHSDLIVISLSLQLVFGLSSPILLGKLFVSDYIGFRGHPFGCSYEESVGAFVRQYENAK
jgi:hypothetical protein